MKLVPIGIDATPAAPERKDGDWAARRNALGLRQVLSIAQGWQLAQAELARLLGTTPRTVQRWRAQADDGRLELSADAVERLSYLLGIHKALMILLPTPDNQRHWLRHANADTAFGGQAPLARMLSGQVADLYVVRRYLDGARG